jgi:methyl-accepting chemotaxis protein
MADLQRLNKIKQQVEQMQQKADRAEGALEQLMEQLKTEFDCKSVKEAKTKLEVMKEEVEELEKKFEEALTEFEKKWEDVCS